MRRVVFDTLFLLLLLIAFIVQLPATIVASYLFGATYVLFDQRRSPIRAAELLLWLTATGICMLSALTLNHEATPIFYLALSPFLYLSARYFTWTSIENVVICLRNVFWFLVFGIAIGIATNWDDPEPLGAIFPWSSTNGLPSYLIVVQIALSLAYYFMCGRLPILSTIATLVVAVFGLGRGSMITGALILVTSVLFNLTIAKSEKDRKVALFLFFTVIFPTFCCLIVNFHEVAFEIDLLIEGSKFSGGVLDEHRARILTDYLSKIDAWTLLFGTNYQGTSIVQYYGGNPHNSFIRLHSFYGVAGLIFIFVPIFGVVYSKRDFAQKMVFIVLVLMSLLRATTEPIFFPSTLDFFYFLYFVLFYRFSKKKNVKGDSVCLQS